MDPILDLRPMGGGLFTYSLRMPGQAPRCTHEFVGILDHCLHDAANGLKHYFDGVQLNIAGVSIGAVSLLTLLSPAARQLLLQEVAHRLPPQAEDRRDPHAV